MPSGFGSVHLHQLELVPMQMQGVGVIRAVAKNQAVASSLLQHEFPFVRVGLPIHQPGIELARPSRNLLEDHLDRLVRGNSRLADLAKDRVVPGSSRSATHCGCRCWFSYSTITPRPVLRILSSVAPRIHTPG